MTLLDFLTELEHAEIIAATNIEFTRNSGISHNPDVDHRHVGLGKV